MTPIYILHSRPFRNTSLIVEIFSRDHGRICAVAKSARGLKSRYRGKLQPFIKLQGDWLGKRELKTLTTVEYIAAPQRLSRLSLACGFYLNELLLKLLQKEDPHVDLFDYYQQTVDALMSATDKLEIQASLRIFEKNLLDILGYGLPLIIEADGHQSIDPEQYYQYIPQRGFLPKGSTDSQDEFFLGQSLIDLHEERLNCSESLRAAKRLLYSALQQLLGDREIRSRELLL